MQPPAPVLGGGAVLGCTRGGTEQTHQHGRGAAALCSAPFPLSPAISCRLIAAHHMPWLLLQMDPPPRFVVSADMVEMMRREGIAGLFTPEVLLR